MFWKFTAKQRPKRTDYVFMSDEYEVLYGVYDKEHDEFIDKINQRIYDPIWWAYVPLVPKLTRFPKVSLLKK